MDYVSSLVEEPVVHETKYHSQRIHNVINREPE